MDVLRPGCFAAFQWSPESAGLLAEVRPGFKGNVDELAIRVRDTVEAECGIEVCDDG